MLGLLGLKAHHQLPLRALQPVPDLLRRSRPQEPEQKLLREQARGEECVELERQQEHAKHVRQLEVQRHEPQYLHPQRAVALPPPPPGQQPVCLLVLAQAQQQEEQRPHLLQLEEPPLGQRDPQACPQPRVFVLQPPRQEP